MTIGAWFGFKYVGGGHTVYFGLMNTAVHTIMYFYYLLSIYNPEYKKSIWWKKYITQMQLVRLKNTVKCFVVIDLFLAAICGDYSYILSIGV